MKTMQELLEGLNSATLSIWKDACERHASMLKCTLETANSLVHLIEIHNQFHTTKWALSQIETELKRRDELAEANRKALGLDQPDLGEQLWIDGYGEQLDQERQRRKAELNKINRLRVGLPPFAKIPVKEKEGAEQGWVELELNTKPRTCGNCANWEKHYSQVCGWCRFSANWMREENPTCSHFDPLPLPQTPPAEAVEVAESLINICENCASHSRKQDPAGFCAKFGCKMPATNPVDPCVHFRNKLASERAVAALDSLPTQEEFDPNDPRR